MLANGIQVSPNFNPTTSNLLERKMMDLNAVAGTEFELTLQGACKYETDKILIDNLMLRSPIKINEPNRTSGKLIIYPNPSNLNINLDARYTGEVKIIDVLGQSVLNKKLSSENQIDISKLGKGIYFIQITNSQQEISTARFVKE